MERTLDSDYLSIDIDNFGPINHAIIEVFKSNFTVFIGPNMGGKSSIFEALLLPKELKSRKSDFQNSIYNYLEFIKKDSQTKVTKLVYSFRFTRSFIEEEFVKKFDLKKIDDDLRLNYVIILSGSEIKEYFNLFNATLNKTIPLKEQHIPFRFLNLTINDKENLSKDDLIWLIDKNNSKLYLDKKSVAVGGGPYYNPLYEFKIQNFPINSTEEINAVFSSIYLLKPDRKISKSGETLINPVLEPSGENLASVLHYLHSNNLETFRKIEMSLKDHFPDIIRLESPLIDNHLTSIKIIFRNSAGGSYEVWVDQLSTGIIESLTIITFFYLYDEQNALLLIEEPERSLHPGLQRNLIDALLKDINTRRIIVATHSSYLLRKDTHGLINWFLISNGKAVNLEINNSKLWYELINALGVNPSHLLFSKGIIFVEGPSELSLQRILDKYTITRVDLVVLGSSSALSHKSYELFIKFLNEVPIPFLLCLDKDAEAEGITFVNINKNFIKERLIIWDREFEEILGVENYIEECYSIVQKNTSITLEEFKSQVKNNLTSTNLLSKSIKKIFHELNAGSYNKPDVANQVMEKIVEHDLENSLPQIKQFIEKLKVFKDSS